MKRFINLISWHKLLSLGLLFVILFAFGCSKKKPEPDEMKIGAILPLTGESAFWGENIKKGIDLAVDEINQKGGILGRKIVILYEDTQGKPAVGTQAVLELVSIHKVQCVIGDVISSVILAVAPIVERNKCILLGFGESAEITNAGDYIFRNWNSAASDAEITGDFAAKHSNAVVVLSQNDAFGKSAKELFISQLRKNNVKIVKDEVFSKGETDYRTVLAKLQTLEYDGLYIASFHQDTLVLLRQYKELGLKTVNIYGVSSWEEGTLISFLKENFSGKVYFGYPKPPDPNSPIVVEFRSKYKTKYKKEPEILCDNGYDAVYMLKFGIEKAGSYKGLLIKDALYTLQDFKGASGNMSFDQNGDVHKPFGLKTITADGLQWLE